MLGDDEVVAFVATTQPERAKAFYSEVLGLKLVEDGWYAIVFSAGGTTLHIQKVKEFSPLPFNSPGLEGRRHQGSRGEAVEEGCQVRALSGADAG